MHPAEDAPGVAQPPIEPGLRWLQRELCEEETPAKPWRFKDAREALALRRAHRVDALAGPEDVGRDLLAELVVGGVRGAELDEVAARRDAGSKWPVMGLVTLRGSIAPKASWTASSSNLPLRTWCTTQGPASTTVTGTSRLSTSQDRVMPSFLPSRPLRVLAEVVMKTLMMGRLRA